MKEQWTSLAAFVLILLFAGAADGLMDTLGPAGFLAAGAAVLGAAWALTGAGEPGMTFEEAFKEADGWN